MNRLTLEDFTQHTPLTIQDLEPTLATWIAALDDEEVARDINQIIEELAIDFGRMKAGTGRVHEGNAEEVAKISDITILINTLKKLEASSEFHEIAYAAEELALKALRDLTLSQLQLAIIYGLEEGLHTAFTGKPSASLARRIRVAKAIIRS